MIHAREDYSRFQDPALSDPSLLGEGGTPIAENEPVMFFRAQDKHFISVLLAYLNLLVADKEPPADHMVLAITRHVGRAVEWQRVYGSKSPDMPEPVTP